MEGKQPVKNDWALLGPAEFTVHRLPVGALHLPDVPVIDVWFMNLGRLAGRLNSALGDPGNLQTDEGAELRMAPGQLRFARQFYLRMLLGAYLGIAGKDVRLDRGSHGKPVLDYGHHGRKLHFSMAKSNQCVLIGVSAESEVGVDLEIRDRRPRKVEELATRFFSVEEASKINDLPADDRAFAFMRTWACKEAVVKSSGHGIANRFCRFSVELRESEPPRIKEDLDHSPEGWQLALLEPEDGFLAAVAARQGSIGLRGFVLEP